MCEELVINTVAGLAISAFVFYGVQLQGSFVLFWIIYLLTSTFGVGKQHITVSVNMQAWARHSAYAAWARHSAY
jgi:hypothetical protein